MAAAPARLNPSRMTPRPPRDRHSSVYVGNLSFKTSWQDLKDHFRGAGEVLHADVMMDGMGRSRGCGIVVFSSAEEANHAIEMFHDTELEGRKLLVREDREEGKLHERSVPQPRGAGNAPSIAEVYGGPQGSSVYVGNLPWRIGNQELKDFMESAGGEVKHVEVLRDNMNRSKGSAIVRYANAEQAQNAIASLHEKQMEGRYIIVREDREEVKFRNAVSVEVTGLPMDSSWQNVKDHFRECGEILHVEIKDNGTTAIVRFSGGNGAENAIATMNGQNFNGSTIAVQHYQDQ